MSYVSVENRACLYGYSATYPFFWRGGCGQNPGHLNEVIYGIYSPTNYCSIKTV